MNVWTFYLQRGKSRLEVSEADTPNYWTRSVSNDTIALLDVDSQSLAISMIRDAIGENMQDFYSNIRNCRWEYYSHDDVWSFTFDVDVDDEAYDNHVSSEYIRKYK